MAQLAAVSACILTAMDNPVPALKMFIRGAVSYAGILTIIYILGIMPEVKEFWQLALVLAPTLIIFVMMYPHPPLTGLALPTMVSFIMSLNLQNRYSIDPLKSFEACLGSASRLLRSWQSILFGQFHLRKVSTGCCLNIIKPCEKRYIYRMALNFVFIYAACSIGSGCSTPSWFNWSVKQAMNLALIETSAIVDLSRLDELAHRADISQQLKYTSASYKKFAGLCLS